MSPLDKLLRNKLHILISLLNYLRSSFRRTHRLMRFSSGAFIGAFLTHFVIMHCLYLEDEGSGFGSSEDVFFPFLFYGGEMPSCEKGL